MLFKTPKLRGEELEAVERIRELRAELAWQLQSNPPAQTDLLRRFTVARAIRGSASIEGVSASDQDALAAVDRAEPFDAQGAAWATIVNYRDALSYVLRLAGDPHLRFDANLLRGLHYVLLRDEPSGYAGVWRPGPAAVRDAHTGGIVYEAPPAAGVPALVDELLARLGERQAGVPAVVRAALAHLNLAMVRPFADANGRIARCLETLVLAREGVLDPAFCSVEDYLGRHAAACNAALAEVGGGAFEPKRKARPWVRFMLAAHLRQVAATLGRQREMSDVWNEVEVAAGRAGLPERSTAVLVEAAFGFRIRNPGYRARARVSQLVASRDLKLLVDARLLDPLGERRGRSYVAAARLKALREQHRPPAPAAGYRNTSLSGLPEYPVISR